MDWQEIILVVLVGIAIAFLVNYFYQQTKSHDCDDCGLMEMKKKSDLNKSKQ